MFTLRQTASMSQAYCVLIVLLQQFFTICIMPEIPEWFSTSELISCVQLTSSRCLLNPIFNWASTAEAGYSSYAVLQHYHFYGASCFCCFVCWLLLYWKIIFYRQNQNQQVWHVRIIRNHNNTRKKKGHCILFYKRNVNPYFIYLISNQSDL